jgi:hypothetical protein
MDSLTDFDQETSPCSKDLLEGNKFCAPAEDEITALRRLDRNKPTAIKVTKELRDCIKNGAIWHHHKRRNRQRLRENLAQIHRLWGYFIAHEDAQRALLRACDRENIRITARTDVLLALIHLCLRPGDEAAHRYASALREAALQRISPDELASRLAKKGCGVNAMAEAYRQRRRPNSEDHSTDETNNERATGPDSNDKNVGTTLADSADKNIPMLQWEDAALAKWQLNNKSRIYLVVECNGQMAGTILRVKTSLRRKRTNKTLSSSRKK